MADSIIPHPESDERFVLRNQEEVEQFEQLLGMYVKSQIGWTPGHISLAKAFDRFQTYPERERGRLFAALLDLHINLNLLFADLWEFGKGWNKYYSNTNSERGSVLESKEKFFGKMKSHQHASAYILRYRAIWDKLLGFLVLYFLPDDYGAFIQTKSRRRMFIQLAQKSPDLGEGFANQIAKLIEEFDRKFRTPEAHGTGSLRKWSFLMGNPISNPQHELLMYWNALNEIVSQMAKRLDIQKS